eukprot:SM000010S04182  [mRNA]  locus=s10:147346:149284:+ [translate_table: standard]
MPTTHHPRQQAAASAAHVTAGVKHERSQSQDTLLSTAAGVAVTGPLPTLVLRQVLRIWEGHEPKRMCGLLNSTFVFKSSPSSSGAWTALTSSRVAAQAQQPPAGCEWVAAARLARGPAALAPKARRTCGWPVQLKRHQFGFHDTVAPSPGSAQYAASVPMVPRTSSEDDAVGGAGNGAPEEQPATGRGPNEAQTLLLEGARYGDEPDVAAALAAGAHADAADSLGRTALHMAAANGNTTIVRLLLGSGQADVGACNLEGSTALHWAALNGHQQTEPLQVVELLIEQGADPAALNRHERTPVDEALSQGHAALVQAIDLALAARSTSSLQVESHADLMP